MLPDDYYKGISAATSYVDKAPIVSINDIEHRLSYIPHFNCKPGIHIGQRKLFLGELQFLVNTIVDLSTPVYIVYAGAAPGNHLGLLASFFPNVKWILVDPHRFDIAINTNSHIVYSTQHVKYLKAAYEATEVNLDKFASADAKKTGGGSSEDSEDENIDEDSEDEDSEDEALDIASAIDLGVDIAEAAVMVGGAAKRYNHRGRHGKKNRPKIKYFAPPSAQAELESGEGTLMRGEKGSNVSRGASAHVDLWCQYIKKSTATFFVVEDYMTDDYAKLFAELRPYFISDIRTNMIEDKPTDTDVIWNLAQQYNWTNYIRARGYMLKFRTPFYEDKKLAPSSDQLDTLAISAAFGIDFAADYGRRKLTYLAGEVYVQAWAGKSSTESRLVALIPDNDKAEPFVAAMAAATTKPNGKLPNPANYAKLALAEYDPDEYEDRFFYFNCIERGFIHHRNEYAERGLGFDHCNDCALEAAIWTDYSNRFAQIDVLAAVRNLSLSTQRGLITRGHGEFFEPSADFIRGKLADCRQVDRGRLTFAPAASATELIKSAPRQKYTMHQILANSIRKMSLHTAEQYTQLFYRVIKLRDVQPPIHLDDIPHEIRFERGLSMFKGGLLNFAARMELLLMIQFICDHMADLGPAPHYLVITMPTFARAGTRWLAHWFPSLIIMQFGAIWGDSVAGRGNAPAFTGRLPTRGFSEYSDVFEGVLDNYPGLWRPIAGSTLLVADRRQPAAVGVDKFVVDVAQAYIQIVKFKPAAWLTKIRLAVPTHRTFAELASMPSTSAPITLGFNVAATKANPVIIEAAELGYDLIDKWSQRRPDGGVNQWFLAGRIYVNPHGWYGSTQSLLHGTKTEIAEYDAGILRNKIFYWNSLQRGYVHHSNPETMPDVGYDNCGDCALETAIWQKYEAAAAADSQLEMASAPIRQHVIKLAELTRTNMKSASHGMLTRPLDESLLNAMFAREFIERRNARTLTGGYEEWVGGGDAATIHGGSEIAAASSAATTDKELVRLMLADISDADARRWLSASEYQELVHLLASM